MEFDHQQAFRKALEYLLEKRGRGSQTAVAIDAGISQAHLNKIKSGIKSGSIKTLHHIAYALDTTYEDMLALGRKLMAGEPPEQALPETPSSPEIHPAAATEAHQPPPSETDLKLLNVVTKLAMELEQIREELAEIRIHTGFRQALKPDPDKDRTPANSTRHSA